MQIVCRGSKKPEHALKLLIRFAIAKGVVTYGLELMMALFNIVQGFVSTIMKAGGLGTAQQTSLPQEIINAVESCDFCDHIPLWAVTLIGGLFIIMLSFIMILTVYGRFLKSTVRPERLRRKPKQLRAIWDSASSAAVGKGITKGGTNHPITNRFIRRENPMGSVAYR